MSLEGEGPPLRFLQCSILIENDGIMIMLYFVNIGFSVGSSHFQKVARLGPYLHNTSTSQQLRAYVFTQILSFDQVLEGCIDDARFLVNFCSLKSFDLIGPLECYHIPYEAYLLDITHNLYLICESLAEQ